MINVLKVNHLSKKRIFKESAAAAPIRRDARTPEKYERSLCHEVFDGSGPNEAFREIRKLLLQSDPRTKPGIEKERVYDQPGPDPGAVFL